MNQDLAIDIIVNKRKNVFLTGESGAGKTWVINECRKKFEDRGLVCAVTASTGIASTHINGITIHSLSGIGIKKKDALFEHNEWLHVANNTYIQNKLKYLDVIIIDEISMLHEFQFLAVDLICRKIRGRKDAPFGGIQIVVCGDFFQLPPIGESSKFAYEGDSWKECGFITCYLTSQFRQGDTEFLSCLRDVRNGVITPHTNSIIENLLKNSYNKEYSKKILKLFPKNIEVDNLNQSELDKIEGRVVTKTMRTSGDKTNIERLTRGCLAPKILDLKIGAKVMFVKNNYIKGYVNGSMGKVIGFTEFSDIPIVELNTGKIIEVFPEGWILEEYIKVGYDSIKKKDIFEKKVVASIFQTPLRLAFAITTHKSQGMSLDEADIDLSQVFEKGMGYVALSRVRSLNGLILRGINKIALQVNEDVLNMDKTFRLDSEETEKFYSSKMGDLLDSSSVFLEAMKKQKKQNLYKEM